MTPDTYAATVGEKDDEPEPTARLVFQAADEYHADKIRISRSQLVDYVRSPWLYFKRHVEHDPLWQQEPSDAMALGTLIHAAVLEGKRLEDLVHVIPGHALNADGHRKGKDWLLWKSIHDDKPQFKDADMAIPRLMVQSCHASPAAMLLLTAPGHACLEGRPPTEVGVHWDWNGIEMRTRLDRLNSDCIVDFKTCRNAELHAIENVIQWDNLYLQASAYVMAVEQLTGEALPFKFIFCQSSVPFTVVTVAVGPKWIESGRQVIESSLRRLQTAYDTGDWRDSVSLTEIPMDQPRSAKYGWRLSEDDVE